jgi:hypothetical protein
MKRKKQKRPAMPPPLRAPQCIAAELLAAWFTSRGRWIAVFGADRRDLEACLAVAVWAADLRCSGFDVLLGDLPGRRLVVVASAYKYEFAEPQFLGALRRVTALPIPDRLAEGQDTVCACSREDPRGTLRALLAWAGVETAGPLTEEQERGARRLAEGGK